MRERPDAPGGLVYQPWITHAFNSRRIAATERMADSTYTRYSAILWLAIALLPVYIGFGKLTGRRVRRVPLSNSAYSTRKATGLPRTALQRPRAWMPQVGRPPE
jgi:hypothetical protein